MLRQFAVVTVFGTVLSVSGAAQDTSGVIANASKAMGASDLKSITYSGSAATGNFGQSKSIAGPLAKTTITNYTRAIDLGRKVLEKEGKRYDLNINKLLETDRFAKAANELGFQNDELFAQIGYGKLAPKQVLDRLVPQGELKEKAPEHPVVSAVKRVLKPGTAVTDRIVVRGVDDLMVFRARCCNPIRGEKIVGYITRGKGVSVHSANCPNVVNLQYDPERRIDVEWDKGGDVAPYTVRLTMQVEDRKGMIAELSSRIADINTNIITLEASTRAEDRQARIDMTVEIKDVKHLEKVMKSIRGVEGVLGVERAVTR